MGFEINRNIKELISKLGITPYEFSKNIGNKRADNIYNIINEKVEASATTLNKIFNKYPEYKNFVLTGEGEMMKQSMSNSLTENGEIELIPLLPISAQGGSLDDFVVSVKDGDCERIISPIKGADLAITVSGSSMDPEYPSGSKILIKKIDGESFIEWGRCYVLDTGNGVVVKKLAAPTVEDPKYGYDYVTCISVNPDPIYAPFNVPKKDIFGIYRVLMQLTEK